MKSKTTKTSSTTKRLVQKDPKYRVIPNLSLKGKDVMTRLKNRSLILDNGSNQYSLDEQLDDARRMSKLDLLNAQRENANQIHNLKTKLANVQ